MWALPVVVLVCIFFMVRSFVVNSKRTNEITRQAQEDVNRINARAAWEAKVTNTEIQRELEDAIYDGKDWVFDELSQAAKDYPHVATIQKAAVLTIDRCQNSYGKVTASRTKELINIHRESALQILLARRGLLTVYNAGFGIIAIGSGDNTEARRMREGQLEFIRFIDAELKKHGHNERLYFKSTYGRVVMPFERCGYLSGKFVWEPIKDIVV